MKVILSKDVANLGEEGDIRNVARGFARNFLIPQKLVMPYTKESLSILESRREHIDQRRDEKRKAALDIKTRLESEDLNLEMPAGESGRLFGSVTSAAIADALAAQGIEVERKRIDIPEKTIKQVGTTRVRVRLYANEEAELKVVVKGVGGTKGQAAGAKQAAVDKKSEAKDKQAPEPVADEAPSTVAEPQVFAEPQPAVKEPISSDVSEDESKDTASE